MKNPARAARIIDETLADFDYELNTETVYTEAATGNYAVTAPLAALAGADTVYALAKDSSYGTAADAIKVTRTVAEAVGVADKIEFREQKSESDLSNADIVTNTGFVRPIDAQTVSWMKPTAAVPLMFEPWEFRESDVDLEACWAVGVPVVGTNERSSLVETFEYIGPLVLKLAFEAGIEVFNAQFVVIGGGEFAAKATAVIEQVGGDVTLVAPTAHVDGVANRRDYDSLAADDCLAAIESADLLVSLEHRESYEVVGPSSPLDPATLHRQNPGLQLIHICGAVDSEAIVDSALKVVPGPPSDFGYMTVGTEYLGPRPVVQLQAAGLGVGAVATRARQAGQNLWAATTTASALPYGADFEDEIKERYGFRGTTGSDGS